MRNFPGTFVAVAAYILCGIGGAWGDQLVRNSDFELGFTGGCPNEVANKWEKWVSSGGPDYCKETAHVNSPTKAQEIGKDFSAFKAGVKQQVGVKVGASYTATVWIYATSNEVGDFNVERGIVVDKMGRGDPSKIDLPGEGGNFVSDRKWDCQSGGEMGQFKPFSVTFPATTDEITVFTWIFNKWNFTTHSVHDDCTVNGAPAVIKFHDNENDPLSQNTESLQVSQEVTNSPMSVDPVDGAAGFATTDTDIKNFRIQVFDSAAAGQAQVTVNFKLRQKGKPPFRNENLILNNVDGAGRFRGIFHRLVTDEPDQAEDPDPDLPEGVQIYELLDKNPGDPDYEAEASYGGVAVIIPVCRPKGEDNNDPTPKKHDMREVPLRFHAFTGSGATEAQIRSAIRIINDRLWQAAIQVAPDPFIEVERPHPPTAFINGEFEWTDDPATFPTGDETEVFLGAQTTNDNNADTVDIWILPSNVKLVDDLGRAWGLWWIPAGQPIGYYNNLVIRANQLLKPHTLAHELMHILLNVGHKTRGVGHKRELFYSSSDELDLVSHVRGPKRIGDFRGWAPRTAGGNSDLVESRRRAERLGVP